MYVNPTGYGGPTRSASFRTEVNNVVTRFAVYSTRQVHGLPLLASARGSSSSGDKNVGLKLDPREGSCDYTP